MPETKPDSYYIEKYCEPPRSFEVEDFKRDFKLVFEGPTAWVEWRTPAQGRVLGHPAGTPTKRGFVINYQGRTFNARTIAWILSKGEIPKRRVVQTSPFAANCHPDSLELA